jgi:predicted DNA-binding transcriptional regulator YafY
VRDAGVQSTAPFITKVAAVAGLVVGGLPPSMSLTERIYLIDQLLNEHKVVSFERLQQNLGVSKATLKRDLEYMRSRLNAPIEWSREAGGYRFSHQANQTGAKYELPGLWFNESEIHALLTMQHLLSQMDAGGILADQIGPLMARLNAMLGTAQDTADDIRRKVLIAGVGRRKLPLAHFQSIGKALLASHRLRIKYAARSTDTVTEREVSPLRLMYYRENWYLDAWCHLRDGVRNFSLDCVQGAQKLDKPAKRVAQAKLDNALGPGYGIFSQGRLTWATLKFSAYRARWVAGEQWHPNQKGQMADDGSYYLHVPYTDHRELVMDILRFGADCEVIEPPELRGAVAQEIVKMAQIYKDQ